MTNMDTNATPFTDEKRVKQFSMFHKATVR